MTALTHIAVPVPRKEDANLQSLPWRRMAWVTWRQQRAALIGLAALFVAMTMFAWVAGLRLHHAYAAAIACRPAGSLACGDLINVFNGTNGFLSNGLILQGVPALIGAFLGAPLLAREMESGTFRFAWTQGFGRRRWALAKVVALGAVVTAAAGAITVLFSWYYRPYFAAGHQAVSFAKEGLTGPSSPFAPGLFDLRGITFAAWTLAAFAIGAFAGIVIRRVVPAIVATLATYTALAFAAGGFFRQHYLAPLVTNALNVPGSAWVISEQWTKGGRPVSQQMIDNVLSHGGSLIAGKGGIPKSPSTLQYLAQHGFTELAAYQPASRFWPFQWIEGGWLLALSIFLIAATVWLVRRKAA